MAYTQAPLAVENPPVFTELKAAVEAVFSAGELEGFLRGLRQAKLRARDFGAALEKGLFRLPAAPALYAQLGPADQGQIREVYLSRIEQVAPAVRARFKQLFCYY